MPAPESRRLQILDAMILVAGTAAGLALARPAVAATSWGPPANSSASQLAGFAIYYAMNAGLPVLAGWTPAVLAIRLRRPRPSLRRLARQPGFLACAAATPALLLCGLSAAGFLLTRPRLFAGISVVNYVAEISAAVFGAWVALGLSRRWRAERHWIDRAGRVCGVCWLAADALLWLRMYLY